MQEDYDELNSDLEFKDQGLRLGIVLIMLKKVIED